MITNESVTPNRIWPPNHRMIRAIVSYNVADNYDTFSQITRQLSVSSNEPVNGTGDGDTAPDWTVSTPNMVYVRAERSGKGTGRVYTVTITARDRAGNSSSKTVTITVPHSNSRFEPTATAPEKDSRSPASIGAAEFPQVSPPEVPMLRKVIITRPSKWKLLKEDEEPDKEN